MSDNFKIGCIVCLISIPILIGLFFLDSWFVMLLWNAIVPVVMWCQPLTYWHAVGINLLISLLFGGGGIGKSIGTAITKSFSD